MKHAMYTRSKRGGLLIVQSTLNDFTCQQVQMPTENGLKPFLPLCCLSFSAGSKAKLGLRSYGRCSRCSGEAGTEEISPFSKYAKHARHAKYVKYADFHLKLAGLDVSKDGGTIAACLTNTANINSIQLF